MGEKIIVTGVKPTGTPHIGNYIGAIKPALALADQPDTRAFLFIADYHALTAVHDAAELRRLSREVAATWLAMGLDPEKIVFYRQSEIPEIFELAWILACFTAKGLMNRAHAYKAAVAQSQESGNEDVDAGVNMGLFSYPVLMAADVIVFGADFVPVGRDQAQHLEIARDIAERVNHTYGPVLKVPAALIGEDTAMVPGLDGRKMSKSYGNTVPLFAESKDLKKLVFRYVTDSSSPTDPKDPATSSLFAIYKEFASPAEVEAMREQYRAGIGWGKVKEEVVRVLDSYLAEPRRLYGELMADPARLDALLARGAERARAHARPTMERLRAAIGVR